MSARKTRPMQGDTLTPEMSQRDIAAAWGMSKGALWRCRRLATIPEDEFDRRIAAIHGRGERLTKSALLRGTPAPARGRVDRAKGIVCAMTGEELAAFLVWFAQVLKS